MSSAVLRLAGNGMGRDQGKIVGMFRPGPEPVRHFSCCRSRVNAGEAAPPCLRSIGQKGQERPPSSKLGDDADPIMTVNRLERWSGWGDSNSRLPRPERGALPLGHTPAIQVRAIPASPNWVGLGII